MIYSSSNKADILRFPMYKIKLSHLGRNQAKISINCGTSNYNNNNDDKTQTHKLAAPQVKLWLLLVYNYCHFIKVSILLLLLLIITFSIDTLFKITIIDYYRYSILLYFFLAIYSPCRTLPLIFCIAICFMT